MKKNLRKPTINERTKSYKSELGLKIATIATALGLGAFAAMGLVSEKTHYESLTIGILKDLPNDQFEKSVPLYIDPKLSVLSSELKDGSVIITSDNTLDETSRSYKVYTFNNKGTIVKGYVESKYLKNSAKIQPEHSQIYVINGSKGANLRLTPEITADNKIGSIPANSIVLGGKQSDWTEVIYLTSESMETGFVSGELLKKKTNLFDRNKNKSNYIAEKDNVLGIDISDFDEDELRKVLTGETEIPEILATTRGQTTDISEYKIRKPNYVYIKLSASRLHSENISRGVATKYKEFASICEELKIPYGFYYYSTSINREEATQEFEWIRKDMDKLPKRKYNLLPFAIDVEVSDERDRQYRASIEEVTDAKVELANLIERTYIGKTVLYTARNTCDKDLAKRILDLEQYQKGLNTGPSHVWYVSPKGSKAHAESLNKIKHHVHSKQILLDAKLPNIKNQDKNLLDFNTTKEESFMSYLTGEYAKSGIQFAKNTIREKAKQRYLAINELER